MAYWEYCKEDLDLAKSLRYLIAVIQSVLKKMKDIDSRPIVFVFGPTPLYCLVGDEEGAFQFRRAVTVAERNGFLVFDQSRFHKAVINVVENERVSLSKREYFESLFGDLINAIAGSHVIKKVWLLPDWDKSNEAVIGSQIFKNWNIPVESYPEELLALL
jgi:hypothetical protein